MDIKGKKAVIVGGASDMAKASAEMLRERSASIAILDLPDSAGADVARQLGGSFHPVDVMDEKAKAGIAGMTLTMARDLGGLGIRVVTIAPS
jgi:NAD(P)-dependent dehydrogenase (short-subunit alcohol dehydrogenase family)